VREVGAGSRIQVNVTGDRLFDAAFAALGALQAALQGDDAAAAGQSLTALDGAQDSLLAMRAQVGASMNRMESLQAQLADQLTSLQQQLSQVEDADLAETLVQYNEQQNVYAAGLGAGARAVQPSLFDYLG
jgi:flagellar hook-associated protein 3 FlgL